MSVINITTTSVGNGLKEAYKSEGTKRGGMRYRFLISKVITFAVENQDRFEGHLKQSREKGGKHISVQISKMTKEAIANWAKKDGTSQSSKANFILEKALEDEILDEIVAWNS